MAFNITLFGLSIMMQPLIGFPGEHKQFNIETRILRILPFQTKMISGHTQKQGVIGNVIVVLRLLK